MQWYCQRCHDWIDVGRGEREQRDRLIQHHKNRCTAGDAIFAAHPDLLAFDIYLNNMYGD